MAVGREQLSIELRLWVICMIGLFFPLYSNMSERLCHLRLIIPPFKKFCTVILKDLILYKNAAEHIKISMITIWQCLHLNERCQQPLDLWYHISVPDLLLGFKDSLLLYRCLFLYHIQLKKKKKGLTLWVDRVKTIDVGCQVSNYLDVLLMILVEGIILIVYIFLSLFWLTHVVFLSPFFKMRVWPQSVGKKRGGDIPSFCLLYMFRPVKHH